MANRSSITASARLRHRTRATGLLRAIVVACSTLAILVVCFWIYEFSEPESPVAADPPQARTTSKIVAPTDPPTDAPPPSLATGRALIGPGEKIRMTFYPREGNRARVELSADAWTPVPNSDDRFRLTNPDIRMRTNSGHAVRITAALGIMEAQRKPGGGLHPTRGTLSGGVLIRYDRLTEEQRAERTGSASSEIAPEDLITIELEELDFDLEYSKVIVPGRILLTASDVLLETGDLEVKFDEEENRIEELRISQAGRLELRDQAGRAAPSLDTKDSSLPLLEWLRAAIQNRIDKRTPGEHPDQPTQQKPAVAMTDDGIPIFRPESHKEKPLGPPARYLARFEGQISLTQFEQDTVRTSLEADTLEIIRTVASNEPSDADAKPDTKGEPQAEQPTQATAPRDRIVLTWQDRLVIQACHADNPRCASQTPSTITATGSPVKLSLPEGEARCARLKFEPNSSQVWLYGNAATPAVVELANQGTIHGQLIHTKRIENDFIIHVDGPGKLVQPRAADDTNAAGDQNETPDPSSIEFQDSFDAYGRFVTRTTIDLKARLTTTEERVLDRAVFVGQVHLRDGSTTIDADEVILTFNTTRGWGTSRQSIKQVRANGHVTMHDGQDSLQCRELVADFVLTADGTTVPRTAVAMGEVVARQGSRIVQARDKLMIDFTMVERIIPVDESVDPLAENATAPDPLEATSGKTLTKMEPGISRFRAFADVTIVDEAAGLHVEADEVDCTIANGREIERAIVSGVDQHPATVRLKASTIMGDKITLDLIEERAEVSGPGRLTMMSQRDLDGRELKKPVPITITWADRMVYRGRDNRAVFLGNVHATSASNTSFDTDRLDVEFDDVAQDELTKTETEKLDWWILQPLIDRVTHATKKPSSPMSGRRFAKKPAVIIATGRAVAMTSDIDPDTGFRKSRSRIAGPKLWVNLRPDVAKMQIEGAGTLLLEDNQPFAQTNALTSSTSGGFLSAEGDPGPSNTLIEWSDLMWYDFSTQQTVFQGDVQLKHFSGAELIRLRGHTPPETAARGRRTFLSAQQLKIDFQAGKSSPRMGLLSSDRLRQFEASRSVVLQDDSEGLHVTADRIVFRRNSDLLSIFGSNDRKAVITTQRPGQPATQMSVNQIYYNLRTHSLKARGTILKAR